MDKPAPDRRDQYPHFLVIPTRWMDNDVYGHVNNVIYLFVLRYSPQPLSDQGALNIETSPPLKT